MNHEQVDKKEGNDQVLEEKGKDLEVTREPIKENEQVGSRSIEELKQQIAILNDEIFKLKNSKIISNSTDVWEPQLDESMIKKLKERNY